MKGRLLRRALAGARPWRFLMSNLNDDQKKWIDDMIRRHGLNEFGDAKGTVYSGGTPLFDERSGKMWDRYEYILHKHRDWVPQKK